MTENKEKKQDTNSINLKNNELLEALEEDDEFQEFSTQDDDGHEQKNDETSGNQTKTQWLTDWDDDMNESNFIANLRKELQ